MYLKEHPRVQREIFLDSDNLQDSGTLFATVANQTDSLVVLRSAEVLSRPWCVGEMITARLHGVDVILDTLSNLPLADRRFRP